MAPSWLPPLILLNEYGGDWSRYLEGVYECFKNDFKARVVTFRGLPIRTRYHPSYQNRDYSFWHLIQEGQLEEERTPDLRRCERIAWIRAVIEHSNDPTVRVWENERFGERRALLWLEEEFLVVLGDRRKYWLLLTAYTTEHQHRRNKLRKEYEAWKKAGPAPLRGRGPNTPSTPGG